MNSYNLLQTMCSQDFLFESIGYPITAPSRRVEFIQETLPISELHSYEVDGETGHNVYCHIDVDKPNTMVFLAHHDVVRPNIQNCNDNTASVSQLMYLANRLNMNRHAMRNNVVVALVDHEETCDTLLSGASELSKHIKEGKFGNVVGVVNLELTSCGTHYWMNPEGIQDIAINRELENRGFNKVYTPMNDAVNVNSWGVSAVCIGSFRDEDYEIVVEKKRMGCDLWRSCHADDDTFEKWANETEMTTFNNTLYHLACNFNSSESVVYDMDKVYTKPVYKAWNYSGGYGNNYNYYKKPASKGTFGSMNVDGTFGSQDVFDQDLFNEVNGRNQYDYIDEYTTDFDDHITDLAIEFVETEESFDILFESVNEWDSNVLDEDLELKQALILLNSAQTTIRNILNEHSQRLDIFEEEEDEEEEIDFSQRQTLQYSEDLEAWEIAILEEDMELDIDDGEEQPTSQRKPVTSFFPVVLDHPDDIEEAVFDEFGDVNNFSSVDTSGIPHANDLGIDEFDGVFGSRADEFDIDLEPDDVHFMEHFTKH